MGKVPTKAEWVKATELGFGHRRGGELNAVDDAVGLYEKSPTPENATKIRLALLRWTHAKGENWESDARNQKPGQPIASLLDTVMAMRQPMAPEIRALVAEIERSRHQRMVTMFSTPPRRIRLRLIDAAAKVAEAARSVQQNRQGFEQLKAEQTNFGVTVGETAYDVHRTQGKLAKATTGASGLTQAAMTQVVNELFGTELADVRQLAMTVVTKTGTQSLVTAADHVSSMIPFVCLAKDGAMALYAWGRTINDAYKQYKVISSAYVITDADARAAVQAIRHLLARETAFQATKASIATGAFAANTALHAAKGAGAIASPAVGAAKAAVEAAAAIGKFALEVREAIAGYKILKDPARKLNLKAFDKCPLLGAYLVDCSETSDLLSMVWSEFGQNGWMDEVEALLPDLKRIQIQAGDLIRSSPFVITPQMPTRRAMQGTISKAKRWYSYKRF